MQDSHTIYQEEHELSSKARLSIFNPSDRRKFEKSEKQREAVGMMSNPSTRYMLIYGGSRSGKTFISIYAMIVRAIKYPNSRHCVLRLRYNHAKTSLQRDTIPKVLRVCFPDLVPYIKENKQESFYTFPNGSELWIGGLDDHKRVEKILGNEYGTIYFNECSQIEFQAHEVALTRLAQKVEGMKLLALYDCNPTTKKHWTYVQWVEGIHPETGIELSNKEQYYYMKINPHDNIQNIGDSYLDILEQMSPAKKKRFLEGEFSSGSEAALFDVIGFHKNRVLASEAPDCTFMCVAIDPAAKSKAESDETGIIVAGASNINGVWHYYVFDDASVKGKPHVWANSGVKLYEDYKADRLIGENNNGGDMVESTVRTVHPTISYEGVFASRGKEIRAEPIAALSYRGLLHMVGFLPDLEEECVSWEPGVSTWSPNRLDAMVWAVTWLMSKTRCRNPNIRRLGK